MAEDSSFDTSVDQSYVVVDSSVIIAWLLNETISPTIAQLLDEISTSGVIPYEPSLLNYEVINTLYVATLRNRITVEQANKCLTTYSLLRLQTEHTPTLSDLLQLSLKFNISAYDATYVWLAHSQSIPLCTLDKKLQKKVAGFVEILKID